MPGALPPPGGTLPPARDADTPLPESIDPGQAYARLRDRCRGILADWAGLDLEGRVAFAEKRGTRLRRVEAALILISNLPDAAGPADFGPLAASFESGELAIFAMDEDAEGHRLGAYARRMASKG
jgi:hypothetical protein